MTRHVPKLPKDQWGYSPALADKMINALECGLSREQAAAYAGMSFARIEAWLRRGHEGLRPYGAFLIRALEAEARAIAGPLVILHRVVQSQDPDDRKLAVDVAKFLVQRADAREARKDALRLARGSVSLDAPPQEPPEEQEHEKPIIIDAESFSVEQARAILAIEEKTGEELAAILADE